MGAKNGTFAYRYWFESRRARTLEPNPLNTDRRPAPQW